MTAIAPEQRTAVGCHRRELEVILASVPAGAATIVACAARPGSCGPPLHVHAASDETFFVLSGVLLVHADGQVATIPEGGLVHVSGGIPHTFATTPGRPARFFVMHTPGGSGGDPHIAVAHAVQEHVSPLPRDEIIRVAQVSTGSSPARRPRPTLFWPIRLRPARLIKGDAKPRHYAPARSARASRRVAAPGGRNTAHCLVRRRRQATGSDRRVRNPACLSRRWRLAAQAAIVRHVCGGGDAGGGPDDGGASQDWQMRPPVRVRVSAALPGCMSASMSAVFTSLCAHWTLPRSPASARWRAAALRGGG
jgi:mannose-6-phosphate isomerase-like protein (cupin superfamily)